MLHSPERSDKIMVESYLLDYATSRSLVTLARAVLVAVRAGAVCGVAG